VKVQVEKKKGKREGDVAEFKRGIVEMVGESRPCSKEIRTGTKPS
jgi:hypothetical protein